MMMLPFKVARIQSLFAADLFLCFSLSERGSTGSKQTSKGLFIFYLLQTSAPFSTTAYEQRLGDGNYKYLCFNLHLNT